MEAIEYLNQFFKKAALTWPSLSLSLNLDLDLNLSLGLGLGL